MKLLLDEQISGKVAKRLGQRGHDVVALTDDAALRGLSDPEVFSEAQKEDRTVVTYNRDDFLGIVATYGQAGTEHSGLVIVNPKRIPNDNFSLLTNSLDRFLKTFKPYPSFVQWLP